VNPLILLNEIASLLEAFEENDDPLEVSFERREDGTELGAIRRKGVLTGVIIDPQQEASVQTPLWVVERDGRAVLFCKEAPGVKEMAIEAAVHMIDVLLGLKRSFDKEQA